VVVCRLTLRNLQVRQQLVRLVDEDVRRRFAAGPGLGEALLGSADVGVGCC
jgi:hypothetical protein